MALKQSIILLREFLSLRNNFRHYFRLEPVIVPQKQREVYRLRYQVYCQELGWELENQHLSETDEYNEDSIHCLMRSVSSGESVGCVRLILPNRTDPSKPLPFEKACGPNLSEGYFQTKERDQFTMAEVSPIVVAGKYRRRKLEQETPGSISKQDFGTITKPRFPYIAVGLYLGALHTAKRNNINTLYFLAEPWLQEHFNNLGIRLSQIGQPVQRYGECTPCTLNVPETISNMSLFVRPLFKQIAIEIDAYHWSHYKRRLMQGC